ncbi:MAG TPA: hypothetical protein VK072_04180 [Candidatus Avamphibacillus sp.]|nr:hypothetical protein [Candidatus Avamphibacillus sp.]
MNLTQYKYVRFAKKGAGSVPWGMELIEFIVQLTVSLLVGFNL